MLEPHIDEIITDKNKLSFEIKDTHVSIINGIRRTITSDIPICVFKTTPHEENEVNIVNNTSRFNNEIIKQRMSCIPIHIKNLKDVPYDKYIVEINVKNNTNDILMVTTADFKIKDTSTDIYVEPDIVKQIFPPFISPDKTEHYIDFIRLRPKITDNIPGEHIEIYAKINIGTAKQYGMYNVVSTCTYGNIIDTLKADDAWESLKNNEYKSNTEDELILLRQNFNLLEAQRYYKNNEFLFKLESIGIFTTFNIMVQACNTIIYQINNIKDFDKDKLTITNCESNTMTNCYDIILHYSDFTIGKILEYILYYKYYENESIMNYVSFYKKHPHDDDCILRVAFINETPVEDLRNYIQLACIDIINIINIIKSTFDK